LQLALIFAVNRKSAEYQVGQTVGLILLILILIGVGGSILIRVLRSASDWEPTPRRRRRYDDEEEKTPRVTQVPREKLEPKDKATKELLQRVGRVDPWFEPDYLRQHIEHIVKQFQDCWESRDFEPLMELLNEDCYATFLKDYDDKKKRKEMTHWDEYELDRIQFVQFKARGREMFQSFTAVLTAGGKGKVQEFWTFERSPKRWLLVRMRGAAYTDPLAVLNELPPNVLDELVKDREARELLRYASRT
jgi:predicted lipid-binding transport protein (Tim44 family)